MLRAISRGLTLSDFENMTIGMIIGYITAHNNENMDEDEEDNVREATQSDFNNF